MRPLVTIGLPFRNNRDTLGLALESAFMQTLEEWELIAVDDGSTDDSAYVLKDLGDHRIRVVRDGKNLGLANRLNQIAELASGKYIARMDADDMMHPERLATLVGVLENNDNIDVVGSGAYLIDTNNRVYGARWRKPIALSASSVLRHGALIHPTILGKRSWCLEHRYNEAFLRAQDRELWCRVWSESNMVHMPEPLYFYREQGSVTWRKYHETSVWARRAVALHGPRLVGQGQTWSVLAEMVAKDVVMWVSDRLGSMDVVKQSVKEQLERSEIESVQSLVDLIVSNATEVPASSAE